MDILLSKPLEMLFIFLQDLSAFINKNTAQYTSVESPHIYSSDKGCLRVPKFQSQIRLWE